MTTNRVRERGIGFMELPERDWAPNMLYGGDVVDGDGTPSGFVNPERGTTLLKVVSRLDRTALAE